MAAATLAAFAEAVAAVFVWRADAAIGETFLVPIAEAASFLGTMLVIGTVVPAAKNALSGGKSGEKPLIKAESPANDFVDAEAAITVGIYPCCAG